MIIDDLMKLAEEAYNELVKKSIGNGSPVRCSLDWKKAGKIIIIMTRWASDDLAGRALDYLPTIGMKSGTFL